MSQKFTLPTGAVLEVSVSSFSDASQLRKQLLAATRGVPLPSDLLNEDVTALKDLVVNAACSDAVEEAFFRCADKALYNGVRVSRELFDDPKIMEQARRDYYAIMLRVIEVNCEPFFEQLFSVLKTRLGTKAPVPSAG